MNPVNGKGYCCLFIKERNEDLIAIFRNNSSQPSVVLHTDQWEIPMDVIQFDHLLGEGCFGEVYLGRLREDFTSPMLTSHFRQSNNKGFVAIKLLKRKLLILIFKLLII